MVLWGVMGQECRGSIISSRQQVVSLWATPVPERITRFDTLPLGILPWGLPSQTSRVPANKGAGAQGRICRATDIPASDIGSLLSTGRG